MLTTRRERAHLDACGQREGWITGVCVDVINGWPLSTNQPHFNLLTNVKLVDFQMTFITTKLYHYYALMARQCGMAFLLSCTSYLGPLPTHSIVVLKLFFLTVLELGAPLSSRGLEEALYKFFNKWMNKLIKNNQVLRTDY